MIELAWAAGFFDGEGSTTYGTQAKALSVTVGQKHPAVLQRLTEALGIGRVHETPRPDYPWYTVAASGEKAVRALTLIWPYLSEPKKSQAREALAHVRALRAPLTRRVASVEAAYDRLEEVMQS